MGGSTAGQTAMEYTGRVAVSTELLATAFIFGVDGQFHEGNFDAGLYVALSVERVDNNDADNNKRDQGYHG